MEKTAAKTAEQAEMLANRLRKRLTHLRKWARRNAVEAFRLYDRDIPEIPLVLDFFGSLPEQAAIAGALYKRPYEKDETEEAIWLDAMRRAAAEATGVTEENVIIKERKRQRGTAQYEKVSQKGLTMVVSEGNLKFRVNLSDYLDTGLFLDRRAMRRMVAADSQGKRVLNLFCYTASFSVHAAAGGAASTDSVDLSNTYLAWGSENLALNGFESQTVTLADAIEREPKTAHTLVRADVSEFIETAARAGLRWDSIVLDPPAFSNSKMARGDFDLRRNLPDLLDRTIPLLSPGGKIWLSASARSFRGTAAELEAALAGHSPRPAVADISRKAVDEDFRDRKLPRTFLVTGG